MNLFSTLLILAGVGFFGLSIYLVVEAQKEQDYYKRNQKMNTAIMIFAVSLTTFYLCFQVATSPELY